MVVRPEKMERGQKGKRGGRDDPEDARKYFEGQSGDSSMGEKRMKKARWPLSGGGGPGVRATEAPEAAPQVASAVPMRTLAIIISLSCRQFVGCTGGVGAESTELCLRRTVCVSGLYWAPASSLIFKINSGA